MQIVSIRAKPYKRGLYERNPLPRDYQAIGEFITACSLIEVSLHQVLRSWLGVDEAIARALVGEPRYGDLVDKVKFAYRGQSQLAMTHDTENVLNALLAETSYINRVRSIVAHKPCWGDGIALAFTNEATANNPSKTYLFTCTRKQLTALAQWAVEVAVMLREFLGPARQFQAHHVGNCHARLASLERSLLPSLPQEQSQPTAKRTRQQKPSRQKSGTQP